MASLRKVLSSIKETPWFSEVSSAIRKGERERWLRGLSGSSKASFIATLREEFPQTFLVITPHLAEAEHLYEEIQSFLKEGVYLFPSWEILPYEDMTPHEDITSQRLEVLQMLLHHQMVVVIAPIQALLPKVPPPTTFQDKLLRISLGGEMDL